AALAADPREQAVDHDQVAGDELLAELGHGSPSHGVHAELGLHALMAAPEHGPEVIRRIVEEVRVPAHVHVPEGIAMPGLYHAAQQLFAHRHVLSVCIMRSLARLLYGPGRMRAASAC